MLDITSRSLCLVMRFCAYRLHPIKQSQDFPRTRALACLQHNVVMAPSAENLLIPRHTPFHSARCIDAMDRNAPAIPEHHQGGITCAPFFF